MSKTLKDFDATSANPFQFTGITTRRIVTKSKVSEWADLDSGELFQMEKVSDVEHRLHDNRRYVKVFRDSLSTVNNLPLPAFKLWGYILYILEPKRDMFELNLKEALEFCGWKSRAMYYKGLIPLLDAKLIARRTGNAQSFYINPDVAFNGDRTECYINSNN